MVVIKGETVKGFMLCIPSTKRFIPLGVGISVLGWLCFVPLLSSRDFPEKIGVGYEG